MACWEISGADKASRARPSETERPILSKAIRLPYRQGRKRRKSSGTQNFQPQCKGKLNIYVM